jgi:hypothetical protein
MKRVGAAVALLAVLTVYRPAVRAQTAVQADQALDQIRLLQSITPVDQRQLRDWITAEVSTLKSQPASDRPNGFNQAAFNAFRQRFLQQFGNTSNTPAFKTEFASQTAAAAAVELGGGNLSLTAAAALTRVLMDFGTIETLPALLQALESKHSVARYLAAAALAELKGPLSGDAARLNQVVAAIGAAGADETSAGALRRMYEALAYHQQVGAVFDAYIAIFDARLTFRRGPAAKIDGAEYPAFDLFADPAVLGALTQPQKVELVRRLAVFMRMDAERYNDAAIAPPADPTAPDPGFYEREWGENQVWLIEEILEAIVGQGKGGHVRDQFSSGGYANRAQVLQETYRWIGDPEGNAPGALNGAPWDVPVGAP